VIDPLRLSVEVGCGPERAFELWTAETSRWWPDDHTATGTAPARIVFEPHEGGGVFEVTTAGERVDWGRVLEWDPPRGLTYLWHLRQDRADATEVRIAFVPIEGGGTRLEIEHRGWDRLGARGPDRRDANQRGWAGLLPHFVAECTAGRSG
jgi:uncharacterized protein YndB with AHSA1/START domain